MHGGVFVFIGLLTAFVSATKLAAHPARCRHAARNLCPHLEGCCGKLASLANLGGDFRDLHDIANPAIQECPAIGMAFGRVIQPIGKR